MSRVLRPTWLISALTLLGIISKPWQGPPSDHFDGQRFRNVDPTRKKTLGKVLRWQLNREPQAPWIYQPKQRGTHNDATPTLLSPPVLTRVYGEELRVTYINHATVLIQQHGLNILTDPVWGQRVSPFSFLGPKRFQDPGLSLDELPPIDLILVSHNHYDHLDIYSLRLLAERFPLAKVLSGLGNGELIRECGFTDVQEIDWWQAVPINAQLTVHSVPVQHWSSRTSRDTNRSLWMGFVLDSAEGPVLFPGDTGLGREFGLMRARFGPFRFATLPIGAYAPRWFMRDNHMNPDDAVQALLTLEAKTAMAIHFGTFNLTDEGQFTPPVDLAKALTAREVDAQRFRVPVAGEQWSISV